MLIVSCDHSSVLGVRPSSSAWSPGPSLPRLTRPGTRASEDGVMFRRHRYGLVIETIWQTYTLPIYDIEPPDFEGRETRLDEKRTFV